MAGTPHKPLRFPSNRENLIAREEVLRLQELRGTYGIKAPAPLCPPDGKPAEDDPTCQFVQAPSGTGVRLVPDVIDPRAGGAAGEAARARGASGAPGVPGTPRSNDETEIRLTYHELSALIEDAIRSLR